MRRSGPNARAKNPLQLTARLPKTAERLEGDRTLPRDNPVKDFLLSADAKFADYESYRAEALRVLVIVWDDFCNEPIAALLNENAGLLTPNSFCRDPSDAPVTFPNVDGIIVIRHQHQLLHSTRCEPLIDDLEDAFGYHHDGFPPKAFITVPGGRPVPDSVLRALNAVPLSECMGAEYRPTDLVMWFGGSDDSDS